MTTRRTARSACLAAACAALALLATPAARADDHTDLEGSKIIGNRELPKVLYIVPWKKPVPGEQAAMAPPSVLDEALAPIDRDVFRRERSYHAQVRAAAARPAPTPLSSSPSNAPTPTENPR